ncbi:MAG: hypothetical protein ACTSX9_07645 [Candidatus Njordarchaeales archaeon]
MGIIHIDTLETFHVKKDIDETLKPYQILAIIADEEDVQRCIRKNPTFAKIYEHFLAKGKTILIVPPEDEQLITESPLKDPRKRLYRFCEKLIYEKKRTSEPLKLPLYVLLIHELNC